MRSAAIRGTVRDLGDAFLTCAVCTAKVLATRLPSLARSLVVEPQRDVGAHRQELRSYFPANSKLRVLGDSRPREAEVGTLGEIDIELDLAALAAHVPEQRSTSTHRPSAFSNTVSRTLVCST